MFGVTILGNNSAIPAFNRHPTSQALYFDNQVYLIDCGECTQWQLTRYKIKRSKINHIFISHLHGDHYFGLIGLITSMGLLNRHHALHIYAPEALFPIIDIQLKVSGARIFFPIHYIPIQKEGILLDTPGLEVTCFPMHHRIACWGFLFSEKRTSRIVNPEAALSHYIPFHFFQNLKNGEDYITEEGTRILNHTVTLANRKGRKYAFFGDTLFDPLHVRYLQGVDLLYHETTYLHNLEAKAKERFHSTSKQAATLAKEAGVQKLIIGHFSSQYEDLLPFLLEAKEVFEKTELAIEGITFRIIPQTLVLTEKPSPVAEQIHLKEQAVV